MADSNEVKKLTPGQQKMIRWFTRHYSRANVWLYRKTDGRWGGRFQGGAPVMLVTMRGRKTGLERTAPLIHIPHGEGILLVASQGGLAKNPTWYGNVVANPEISVQVGASHRKMIAREVDDARKAALWPTICNVHPDFDVYQQRTDRNIPVFECLPL
ncbi:MAG: nitroreductase family deazaflavin-dependent oxidoreductase [Myxococcota bacterium]|jgi:deazaflavin-dependent oxidoreductase (nitroreductase family)|nr:nitroreductase family deazaflavin-dependent oxidoreductase [Myxococcota bacterium]